MAKNELTTEQKILRAAHDEFCKRGLDGARMQAIAEKAGVNKALLHYYFRSKEKLFEVTLKNVATDLWTDINRRIVEYRKSSDLRALIHAIVHSYITTFSEHPELPVVIIRETMQNSIIFQKAFHEIFYSMKIVPDTITAILKKESEKKRIMRMSTMNFMMNIMGMCVTTFIIKPAIEHFSGKNGTPIIYNKAFYSQRIQAITDMACDGIFIKE
jgi:TetR/AcrR family transcriptional regulator